MDQLKKRWKHDVANDQTTLGFEAWCRQNDPDVQANYDRTVASALRTVFGEEAVARVAGDEDPASFDLTVCLSAQQRLTCFVEVTVPGSCDEEAAQRLASELDDDMGAEHYEIDEEYWEGGTPTVEGMD